MKIGRTKLRMSSGKIRHFKSQGARDRFEKYARAWKHGWRPHGSGVFTDKDIMRGYKLLK